MVENNRGSVMLTLVVVLAVFLLLCTFVIDTGYLASNKHRMRDAVEAAALSAVYRLCEQDPYDTARHVLDQYETIPDRADLDVVRGFYDEYDDYPDFSSLSEFAPEDGGDFPDEYVNAVMVTLSAPSESLSGLNEDKTIRVSAVAYLKHYGLLSGDDEGEIRIDFNTNFEGGVLQARDIKYPEPVSSSKYNKQPTFTNVLLIASGQVQVCSVTTGTTLGIPWGTTVHWDSCSESGETFAYSQSQHQELPPIDENYLAYMKSVADVVYTPEQAGADTLFWGSCPEDSQFYFDLSGDRSQRTIVYFDTPVNMTPSPTVRIQDGGNDSNLGAQEVCDGLPHTPNYNRLNNITFVTRARVLIDSSVSMNDEHGVFHIGEKGDRQFILVSGGSVDFYSGNISIDGAVIRTNGSFTAEGSNDEDQYFNMRIIAGGDINLDGFTGDVSLAPGPPCPPSIACLGRLD